MGFIKILRWRVGGSSPRSSRRQSIEADSLHRAAVFLVILGQEHASLLFDKFTPEESRILKSEVHSVSEADRSLVEEVLQEYLDGLSTDHLPQYVSREELPDVARAFVRSDPSSVVDRMRALWLDEDLSEESTDEETLLELEFSALEPAQKAAVFMMWLPPELSAMVLHKFPSNLVHLVTGILVELPFVKPEAKEEVLSEFMEGVSLGIPGLSVGDVGLPVVVETFVRSDPEGVAKRLEEKWLANQATVVSPTLKSAPPTQDLNGLEKAAVFFQSLSLPLSHRLLACMEENEVTSLLETIDRLGGVDAKTRKIVLQDLMSQGKAGSESQPIHVLGKAMGQMIRRKPEVVVQKIRKHWLT
jgi:flagellar motor switch protein FliG